MARSIRSRLNHVIRGEGGRGEVGQRPRHAYPRRVTSTLIRSSKTGDQQPEPTSLDLTPISRTDDHQFLTSASQPYERT
jgi:hypothetical protein